MILVSVLGGEENSLVVVCDSAGVVDGVKEGIVLGLQQTSPTVKYDAKHLDVVDPSNLDATRRDGANAKALNLERQK